MPHIPQSTAPVSSRSRGERPPLDHAVALAEAIAQQCVQDEKYVSHVEFKARFVGSGGTPRQIHSRFSKWLRKLSPDDMKRVMDAQAKATNATTLSPEEMHRRAADMGRMPPNSHISARDYYQALTGREGDLAQLRGVVGTRRRHLSSEAILELERARSQWTGLEQGKGGNLSVDVDAILRRAHDLARMVTGGETRPVSAVDFERVALGVGDDVTDAQVRRRFSNVLVNLPEQAKVDMETAQAQAMGRYKKAPTVGYDLNAMVERATEAARDVTDQGQPISLLEFYQRALGYESTNIGTLTVRASQYRKRLTPEQQQKFDDSRAVAVGKKPAGGQVFAPDADHIEEIAALAVKWGSAIFVPSERLADTQSTPLQPIDPKALQLPGLIAVVLDLTKPLVFPVGAIDWKKFAVPPSECRPHLTGTGAGSGDEGNVPEELPSPVGLPEDMAPPVSLSPTPIPRIALTPATVGILMVAGLLVLSDGPFPFGDAAAASLVGGRLLAN